MRHFRDKMLLIVDDSFEMSSQKPTSAEKLTRVDVWSRALFGVVPEMRLQDAFNRAFADHDSPFAVNAYEIKSAWKTIQAEEAAARLKAYDAERAANPVRYCSNQTEHINGDGDVEIVLGGPNGTTVVIPCAACRTEASHQRLAEEQSKLPPALNRPTSSVVIEMFNNAVTGGRRVPETAIEILVRARGEVTDAAAERMLTAAIGYLQGKR